MKAERFLKRVEIINRKIELKTQEREYYLSLATGITGTGAGERVQTSKSCQSMAGAVAIAADILADIKELEEERINARAEIDGVIKTLALKDYTVASMLYISCMSIEEIATDLKKSKSYVFKARNRIIDYVSRVLEESKNER